MPKRKTKKEKAGAEKKRQRTTKELKSSLFDAVKKGNLEELKKIANECPVENDQREKLLNCSDDDRRTLLHVAVEKKQVSIINWLMSDKEGEGRSLGFDRAISFGTFKIHTALHTAVETGHVEAFLAIVNGLRVDNGERKELINAVDRWNDSVLDLAIRHKRASILSWLFSAEGGGMDLELRRDKTSWNVAAGIGDLKCFLAVVNSWRVDNGERQKMLNAVNNKGETLLHKAAEFGRSKGIINWILSNKGGRAAGFDNVLSRTDNRETALHLASRSDDLKSFLAVVNGLRVDNGERREMLNAVAIDGMTVLHEAAEYRCKDIITWILSDKGGRAAGFDNILLRTGHGETALHLASTRDLGCFIAIVNSLRVDNGERREMINAVDNNGLTVLQNAAEGGRKEIITWILSEEGGRAAGFDTVLSRTEDNFTALHYAVQYHFNSNPTRALLSNCTNEERMNLFLAVDKNGWTALHEAARSYNAEEVIDELLSYPECGLIVDRKDNRGMTALHRAIIGGIDERSGREWGPYGNEEIITALLGRNSSPSTSKTTTSTAAKAWIDPNIGLGLL